MTTLTQEEIAWCEERLNDRRFCDRVIKFQKHLFGVFEELRLLTENRFIRYVYQRSEIKSLESVVNKINRKRKTDSSYHFDSIEDLAGIKVVCPYKSSAIETMNWMFRQPTFDVEPKLIDYAWEETQTGYRGWHFIARPSRQLVRIMPNYIEARCEIQVKTMLQEAWDAQTHDVSYKHEEQIDTQLLKQLKTQSDILFNLDEQSETLRELIKGTEAKEREHKNAAAASYLYYNILSGILTQAFQTCYVDLKIENFPLTIQGLSKVNKFIEHYARNKGVDKDLIRFLGYIALNQGDAVQEETAITLAQDYLSKNASDPFAEDAVAGLYWALSRLDFAIAHEKKRLKKRSPRGQSPTYYGIIIVIG